MDILPICEKKAGDKISEVSKGRWEAGDRNGVEVKWKLMDAKEGKGNRGGTKKKEEMGGYKEFKSYSTW